MKYIKKFYYYLLPFWKRDKVGYIMDKSEYPIFLIFLSAIFLGIYLIPLAEFSNDDGNSMIGSMYVLNAIYDSVKDGVIKPSLYAGYVNSYGLSMSRFPSYLHALALFIFNRSVRSVHYFAVLFNAVAIFLTYVLSKELYNKNVGLLSCLLYMTAPAFAVFYSLKVWFLIYLPPFIVLTMFSLYKIRNDNQKYLLLLAFALGMAIQFHATAFLLIPITIIYLNNYLWDKFRAKKLNLRYTFSSLILFLLLSIPYLLTISQKMIFYIFIGFIVVVPCLFLLYYLTSIKFQSQPGYSLIRILIFILLVFSILISYVNFKPLIITPLDLVPGNNEYIESHIGMTKGYGSIVDYPQVDVALLILFILLVLFKIFTKKPDNNDSLVFAWMVVPLLSFYYVAFMTDLNCGNTCPHQWFIVIFPAPFIAISAILNKIYRTYFMTETRYFIPTFALFLLVQNVIFDVSAYKFIDKTGGIGPHRPNLEVEEEVVRYILSKDGVPTIILVGNLEKWRAVPSYVFLVGNLRSVNTNSNLTFYVMEKDSSRYNNGKKFEKILEELPIIEERRIKSVVVKVSPEYDPRVGNTIWRAPIDT